ncbi:MAG: LexA repressor [Eubacterium sp.]|uniref:XRE family transcriptional regulator n=1 Tax=Eubacterium sp. TaxID=142586 RepID=UPI0030538456
MSVGSRIKERRLNIGLTQEQLAKLIGVTKGSIANYENEVSVPKVEILFKLFDALKCDANYLYQDDMDIKPMEFTTTLAEQDFLTKYRKLEQRSKGAVDMLLEYEYEQFTINQRQHEAELQTLKEEYQDQLDLYARRIPYGGTANNAPPIPKKGHKMVKINQFEGAYGAGGGQYNDNTEMVTIEVPEDELPEGADTTMHVAGDSMEPTLSHGDSVYIQHTDTLNIGDIGVFYLDGECFIKEYGDDELISHNPEYAPIQISEFSTFVIQGKVLGKKIEGFVEL